MRLAGTDMILRSLLLSGIVSLAGCGSLVGEDDEIVDPPAELTEFEPSIEVSRIWDTNTGSGTDDQYLLLSPVIVEQRLYIADTDLKLMALDTVNGKNLWTHKLNFGSKGFWSNSDKVHLTGGPGYGANMVLAGSNKGDVIALNAGTGEQLWVAKVSSEILSAPQISEDGTVLVRTLDGKIFALDSTNGRRLWSYDQTVAALTLRGTSTPTIEGNMVICGFDSGRLIALEISSGRVLWETSITIPSGRNDLDKMVDIDAAPAVVEGIIYVTTFQGQIAALALNTGRILWNREMSSFAGFTIDANNIYVTDSKSVIWALDRLNGTPIWKQEGLLNRQVTGPASIGNYIVAGDFEGYLHWMDKTTGSFAARQKISGDRIIAAPVSADNVVYAFSTNGNLAALTYQ